MNALTNAVQIIKDSRGNPAFAVLPIEYYQALLNDKSKAEPGIPAAVVDFAMDNEWSATRAWREYMKLTQIEVAQKMGVSQSAYAQLEAKKTIRKSSREKVAKAIGIHESQLDF
jgi:predicted DNA-binding protein (UPF0251 family)